MSNGSWRVDETYVKVKGRWIYLYRAVDSRGQTIDFLLSAKRDAEAAKRSFRKALAQPHTVNPRTITVDKNAAYPVNRRGFGTPQLFEISITSDADRRPDPTPVYTLVGAMSRQGELEQRSILVGRCPDGAAVQVDNGSTDR
jgi:hypothetical protein